jgi:hypothetical protein
MKRTLAICALCAAVTAAASAQTTFTTHIGTNLFQYETAFLETGATLLTPLAPEMELHLGADFGIATERTDGEIDPSFLIPLNLGLNFTFPLDRVVLYVGTGLTPNFLFGPAVDGDSQFFLGPYARTGIRVKVHELMSAFIDLEQDLLIGGPDWINTSTRILGGIHFSFPNRGSGGGSSSAGGGSGNG